jgi:hypothetical protein
MVIITYLKVVKLLVDDGSHFIIFIVRRYFVTYPQHVVRMGLVISEMILVKELFMVLLK